MCRRATRCFCRSPLFWSEVLGASEIWIGVSAVDYSGYPDCRPEFLSAFERLAALATREGVSGAQIEGAGAARGQVEGRNHLSGTSSGRGLRLDPYRRRPGFRRSCLPSMRRLSASATGLCRARARGPGHLPMSLDVAQVVATVQGESSRFGYSCWLIRLAGCELSCRYCDTEWARSGGQPCRGRCARRPGQGGRSPPTCW